MIDFEDALDADGEDWEDRLYRTWNLAESRNFNSNFG